MKRKRRKNREKKRKKERNKKKEKRKIKLRPGETLPFEVVFYLSRAVVVVIFFPPLIFYCDPSFSNFFLILWFFPLSFLLSIS